MHCLFLFVFCLLVSVESVAVPCKQWIKGAQTSVEADTEAVLFLKVCVLVVTDE